MKALTFTLILAPGLALAAGEAAPAAPKKSAETAKAVPTRFLADRVDDHILEMRRRIAINQQERGPFGLYQVPGRAPIISGPIAKKTRKTPFTEFINQIQISVINSREREFLVGARIFRLGQVFPIHGGGEKISVKVESVASTKVVFKNLQTGEVATRRLDTLPSGISTAGGKIEVRGVTPNDRGAGAPLRLDFNSPPNTPNH